MKKEIEVLKTFGYQDISISKEEWPPYKTNCVDRDF
jgi:hypothetical protein